MTDDAPCQAVVSTALTLVGTPYRLNGRDRVSGLDCIGVVTLALASAGRDAGLPLRSTLRRRALPCLRIFAHRAGLSPVDGEAKAGDIVLVRCSAIQWHALVAVSATRFVHAHAGLRRVVLSAADPSWTDVRHWRLSPTI